MKNEMKTHQDKFRNEFNTQSDVDEMWHDLKSQLNHVMNSHVPSKLTSRKFQQPWVNTEIKRLSNKKKRWFKKMKATNSPSVREKYTNLKKSMPTSL